jgi:hypothetical protein
VDVRSPRHHELSSTDDSWKVDVIPARSGWRRDADAPGIQSRAEIKPDRTRMAVKEPCCHLVQCLSAMRTSKDEVRVEVEPSVVVIKLADDLVGRGVSEDRMRGAVVERSSAQGQK